LSGANLDNSVSEKQSFGNPFSRRQRLRWSDLRLGSNEEAGKDHQTEKQQAGPEDEGFFQEMHL
jgi:hypothetical protein